MKYTLQTFLDFEKKQFETKDFNTLYECKDFMRQNGWSVRYYWYMSRNGQIKKKKLVIENA